MELTEAQIADLSRFDDRIQTFLNAYTFCKSRWSRIYNLLNQRELDYSRQASDVLRALSRESPPQLDWEIDDQILIQAAALTHALSQHIAEKHGSDLSAHREPYRTSVSFGNLPHWLALVSPSPLTSSIPLRPRSLNQLHMTFQRRCHEQLLVTPARVEDGELARVAANPQIENFLERRVRGKSFRVAVSSLSQEADLSGESRPRASLLPPHGFHLTSTGPVERQLEALQYVLKHAYERRAAILVLPELRMPPPLLEVAREFLRQQAITDEQGLLVVAAGSWHVAMPDGRRFNRCVVLRHDGEDLWSHDKLREYEITPENVKEHPETYRAIGVGPGGGVEDIERGQTLQFYDSVIGRLAVAICVGFFSPDVHQLLLSSASNLFLVPSMTTSNTDIRNCATLLVRAQHAYTLVANCGHVGARAPSFCQWPSKGENIRELEAGKQLLTVDLRNISRYDMD